MARDTRRRRRKRARRRFAAVVCALLVVVIGILVGRHLLEARPLPLKYEEEIQTYAAQFQLEPAYVAAVIFSETSFNPQAISKDDARGLMQILPSTGEWIAGKFDETFAVENLFDPATNIRYGCWYLRFLMDRYGEDKKCASAAYHAGQGNVDRWLQDPAFSPDGTTLATISYPATNTYVNRVLANYERYAKIL